MDVGEAEMLAVGTATEVVDVPLVGEAVLVVEVLELEDTPTVVDTTYAPLEFVATKKYVVDCEGVTISDPFFATLTPLIVTESARIVFQETVDALPWTMLPGEAEIVPYGTARPPESSALASE